MQEQPPQNTDKQVQKKSAQRPAPARPIRPTLLSEPITIQIMYAVMAFASILMVAPVGNFSFTALLLFTAVLIVCYYRSNPNRHTAFFEHYRWMIRTFWIGIFCYMPIAVITVIFMILKLSDRSYFADLETLQANPDLFDQNFRDFVSGNRFLIIFSALVFWGGAFLWWFARLWKGFRGAQKGEDFRFGSVTTWLL
ncbi:MAG: hypothetical protein EA357_06150 [Micavibrio sp.]|nr:MAG: hypothetical protein EA357_06150 [Micavibrio sp.]